MILTRRTKTLLLALAATAVIAACDSHNYGDTVYNNGTTGNTGPVKLSALVNSLITKSTTDTATPMEINLVAIDTSSEDPADPNYTTLLGT